MDVVDHDYIQRRQRRDRPTDPVPFAVRAAEEARLRRDLVRHGRVTEPSPLDPRAPLTVLALLILTLVVAAFL